jgi:type VI secretion system secreted protein VgrG
LQEKLSQQNRTGILTTPLEEDVLVLARFDAQEGLSELFEFRIEALSTKPDLDFDDAIGKQCSVKIKTYKKEEREFQGILVETQWLGVKDHLYSYRLVLRPWLWLLANTTDCRIFENKKAPDIIEEVFRDRGFTDFRSEIRNRGSFPTLEYCVQYRETDFNFVSRLMEKEGIYYFFEHKDGKHTLVLANEKTSHKAVPNHATIPFLPPTGRFVPEEQRIEHWISARRFRTGKIELNDYNYEKPNAKLLSDASGTEGYEHSDMEVYDYPGKYKEKSVGERYAKIELESEQAQDHRRQGGGDAVSLFPGGLTTLERHEADSQNIEYLVVRAVHSFAEQAYRSGAAGGASYNGHYEFLPSNRPFRALIRTPKPRIYGIQTAKVVTKEEGGNEEIDVEKLTEIYVWFYWDRKKHKEKRSCKLRVAQVWSGKKWGGQFIPRVGQEAVVEFLEGDPDRPLVVGTVYNDEYQPPYDLPDKKNIAGIKSDSTKGGNGYNEWNFDDTKSSEKITIHAEKDYDVTIKHAETRQIGETFEAPTGMSSRKVELKNGDDELKLDTGTRKIDVAMMYQLKAGVMITFECGASKITMTPASIEIESPLISLSGSLITIN